MRATRGFAVPVRSRGLLIALSAVLALAVSAMAAPSMAGATTYPVKEQYLALGDSLAFGYSLQLYHEGEVAGYEDPENFEHGYANQLYKQLKGKSTKNKSGLKLVNDGCPGETTESFIGSNASLIATLNAALKKSQEEQGLPPVSGESACAYQAAWNAYKTVGVGGPLHHPYSGSQLEDAIAVIANGQNVEHKPVTTVSLNIGANDELHTIGKIEAEAKAYVEAKVAKIAQEYVEAKVAQKAKEYVEAKVGEQVYIKCSEKAFAETGGTEPEYAEKREACLANEGQKLGEEYYAEHQAELEQEGKEYGEKYFVEHKAELEKEGKEYGEKYAAENFFQLNTEGETYAGELILKAVPGLFKQILSNISGIMVALRDGGSLGLDGGKAVNYTGRIIFQSGYNPFGKLFHFAYEGVQFVNEHGGPFGPFGKINGRCQVRGNTQQQEEEKIAGGCTASEVESGFTALVKTLNEDEYAVVHGGYGACQTFPNKTFNPGTQTGEPERLGEWTNMLNATMTNGKYNGPDIHPTPAGYVQLGKEMYKETSGKCKKEKLPGF